MTTFQAAEQAQPAPSRLVLPPTAFMPSWDARPHSDVCVGITVVSEGDVEVAKSAAATEAWQLFPRAQDTELRAEAMNDLLLRYFVARGTCDPNDLTQPFELWAEAPEDIVREALTVEGARAIFDAIERLRLETSPVIDEANDDEIACIAVVGDQVLSLMPEWKAARVRRLLKHCLDQMVEFIDLNEKAQ